MRLIRALRDCKRTSSTVSKKAPTVSRKASPAQKPLSRKVCVDFLVPNTAAVIHYFHYDLLLQKKQTLISLSIAFFYGRSVSLRP